ncbi:hypothetical protein BV22DRAFT_1127311 [Leucogyrophana mollusca]|uniref:Uncharacterized protein n=1 Tax=Leucogyrophana mollusca TaxID=85980 RepID=A0ACB8BQ65_9AGAM|nr:hypothetical protein BV22DRAFT_1127311 [Leucogyrophana mollusca]
MPLITNLIDDKVPLIKYDATWAPGTSADTSADLYYLGTFTLTTANNGAATFSFNGTAFSVYGAKRSNHGTYSVEVDGTTHSGLNGNNTDGEFQVSLFNMTGLQQGMHTVSITNTATSGVYLDIDMIMWQSEVGGANDQLVTETIQDTDSRFQYQEPAWSSNPTNVNFYNNGTGQRAEAVSFKGEIISLYGTVGLSNGPYSVKLDNGPSVTYNATQQLSYTQIMLYYADNLGSGQHQLTITNLPETSGQSLNIDYATLTSLASASSESPSGVPGPNVGSPVSTSTSGLSAGAIAGVAVAAAVAVAAIISAAFLYKRWKGAQAAQQELYRIITPRERVTPGTGVSAYSSSLETRGNGIVARTETPSTFSGGGHQTQNSAETSPLVQAHSSGHRASAMTATGSELPPPNYSQAMTTST